MKDRLRAAIAPLMTMAMFVLALYLLHQELRHYHWRDVVQSLEAIPRGALALAVGLTALNYAVLPGYDFLATRTIGERLPLRRIALVGVVGYAATHSFGTLLGGSPVRYRLYSTWGLSAVEIVKVIAVAGLSFWIGLAALASVVFLLDPLPIPARLHLPVATVRPLGMALLAISLAYLGWSAAGRAPLRWETWELKPPPLRLAVSQVAVGSLDVTVAASVLYVLLPAGTAPSFVHFLAIYLLAIAAVVGTQVPGGLGVLEVSVLVLLAPLHPIAVAGPLVAYRVIYYLIPLAAAGTLLGAFEAAALRHRAAQAVSQVGQWFPILAPRLLALCVFVAGAILLFSGATPAQHGRMALVRTVLPSAAIEASHFLGSIAGVLLLILAHGLLRRSDAAWLLAACLLAVGSVLSLLKGFDYEEAIFLAVMLAALLPCRREFYRQGALLAQRFTASWTFAVVLVLACAAWLTVFAHQHAEHRNELWWAFALHGEAPRSLRALVGAVVAALAFGVWRLVRPKAPVPQLPTSAELETAAHVVARSPTTTAWLALLGDKRLLFNETRTALVMFGVEGRSWVALGDPLGPADEARELAWRFRDLCDESGAWPVFYQVDPDHLPLYIDLGLTLLKLGEEARVPLADFGLEGGIRKNMRRTHRHVQEAGCQFEMLSPSQVASVLPELRTISDAWMAEKNVAEKGFSLGFFQPAYLCRFPAGVVRREGRPIAFANVLTGAGQEELSVDLMRYRPDAPPNVMEFLFLEIMLWGRQQGYAWFNLGMAPLSGIEGQRLGPLWNRVAALAYRHGEHFYNFQGLRQYKEKFDPQWRPKYLASPGGWVLPAVLTNIATLISGGLRGLIAKPA